MVQTADKVYEIKRVRVRPKKVVIVVLTYSDIEHAQRSRDVENRNRYFIEEQTDIDFFKDIENDEAVLIKTAEQWLIDNEETFSGGKVI